MHAHTGERLWLETQFKDVTNSGIISALMDHADMTQHNRLNKPQNDKFYIKLYI